MFHHWTFSHPGAQTEGRAPRYEADMRVCVTIPFESWQLLWTLRSVNISNTGVLAAFDVHNPETGQKAMDLDTLLDAQPDVMIQIDAASDDFCAPAIQARMTRKTKKPWGLEVAFQFTQENEHLAHLVASLESGSIRPRRPN
jgi:hypothetical protein